MCHWSYPIGDGLPLPGSATSRIYHSQGPPLPGFAAPRVCHSQGPALPGFTAPRERHSQGFPLYSVTVLTFRPPYPFDQILTRIALHENGKLFMCFNRSWIDENNSLIK